MRSRFAEFRAAGLGQMDALHLARAVELGADALLTTDDRLVGRAARLRDTVTLTVLNPAVLVQEPRQ